MLVFLSNEELQAFTGLERPSAQARWLRENGFPFEIGGDGSPKVLQQVVIARLGGTPKRREPEIRFA